MALINRQTLKNYFRKGGFATEKHFVDLIDSSLNAVDDGISIKPEYGFKLNPLNLSTRLISFFKKNTQKEPNFSIDLDVNNINGLSFQNSESKTILKFNDDGKVGVNTNHPAYDLDVNGTLGIKSKVGTFIKDTVPADGKWHTIIDNLDGLNGFEINATAKGKTGSGYYSISHAIALSAFGGRFSRSKIRSTTAFYESYRNKIQYRWIGKIHDYKLEIRTRRNYGIDAENGEPFNIKFNIIHLFSE